MATRSLERPLGAPTATRRVGWVRVLTATRVVVVVASLVPVGVYLYVALRRLGYPYELEWLEGGAVEIVRRAADGQSLYVAPTLHYVPYPYTPLYFWVSGLVAHVTGVGFLPLRLVSVLSSVGCFAILFRLVQRETGDPVAGALAAGLFAATYEIGFTWLDIGRVDSMYLLLLLASVAAARRAWAPRSAPAADEPSDEPGARAGRDVRAGALVGVLVFAAFFTKQSGLIAMAPVLVLLVVRRRRAGVAALGTVAALVAGSTVVLDHMTGGWYDYYVYGELMHQGVNGKAWGRFLPHDLLRPMWWAVLIGAAGLVVGARRRVLRGTWAFWLAVGAGLVASSFVARLHAGGAADVLIPAYAAISLLAGLGYGALLSDRSSLSPSPSLETPAPPAAPTQQPTATTADGGRWVTRSPAWRAGLGAALAVAVVLQVAGLRYAVGPLVPTATDATAGRHLVALIGRQPGAVLVFDHPWYETMAGKPSFAQGEAVHDVLRSGPGPARRDLRRSIRAVLATPRVTTVLVDGRGGVLRPYLRREFRLGPPVFTCGHCFFPPTDLALRPYLLYHRR